MKCIIAAKRYIAPILVIIYMSISVLAASAVAQAREVVSCDIPYLLGRDKQEVRQGESFPVRIVAEADAAQPQLIPVSLQLPSGFSPVNLPEYWQAIPQEAGSMITGNIPLDGGYGHWFDLVTIKTADGIKPGTYTFYLEAGRQKMKYDLQIAERTGEKAASGFYVENIILPLDREGKKDDRLHDNTIVLRDRTLDYLRNLIRGKGASNLEAEEFHPISYLGIDVKNPQGEQKLVTWIARLLNYETRQPEAGLITSKAGGDDDLAYEVGGLEREGSRAFTAITGAPSQRILLPLYADERLTVGGRYWLQVSMFDGVAETVVSETEVTIVKKNYRALVVVGCALLVFVSSLYIGLPRLRKELETMKTRWLITIALFGTTTFACVNVPSTLLGDFFHILLGPFGFLVTGLFTGVFLYMLLISLMILIPRPGVVTLVMAIRLLLGMIIFGNVSLVSFLSYGLQALFLEVAAGFWLRHMCLDKVDNIRTVLWQALPAAVACAVADCITTYVNIQTSVILYRLYFADWYIYLVLLFNGFLYTVIGVGCGFVLGWQLVKIRGD
ncbi:MAG: hypothetical protein H6Q69_237 [Firmicutes bacterium]|nr:hypothetical protein [Bacillota bacterium]